MGYVFVSTYGSVTITNNSAINNDISAGNYAGRIVSYIEGTASISNNFALDFMIASGSAQFDATQTKYHGVSKTNAQLRTQSTYSGAIVGDGLGGLGWKFGNDDDTPWQMPADGGHPILYWQQ